MELGFESVSFSFKSLFFSYYSSYKGDGYPLLILRTHTL